MRRWDIIDAMRKMKKTLLSLAVASLAVVFASCGGNKQMAYQNPPYGYPQQPASQQTQKATEDDELAALRREQEKQAILHEMEVAKKKQEQELRRLDAEAALQEKMKEGNELLVTFCIDEAMDKEGEYLAGLGISSNQTDEKDALISANRVALSDISSRFLGVVQNAVSDYSKETNTRTGQQIKESQLEGLAMSVGENVVNKHANVVCRKVVSEAAGTYGCYVAVHVVIKDAVGNMLDELEKMAQEENITDFNKYLFEKKMNEMLKANQEKESAKQQEQLKNIGLE